ncbi:class I SAM-dependent methyltransferase [Nocardioides sp. NPDC051685]|uniref:class I SAM-dependent methyltransferase n=1 Tax=Nocardioides sp. NPDC051685 TaxID=3364334 RepID=UPI0037B86DF9
MIATDLEEFYGSRYDESLRLGSSVKGRLELARVRELVTRHLPVSATRVADIGGGTGAHARWLRAEGYEVDLIDPIPRHVEAARAAGIRALLGDARDLPWNKDQFDVALMAGPLYHLTDPEDRRAALLEAARVVRPGGLVAAVAFNRHANLLGATLANQFLERRPVIEDIEAAGFSDRNDRVSPATYYTTIPELTDEMSSAGLTNIAILGLTGPGGWLGIVIDAHFPNPADWPQTLTNQGPLKTALASARAADEHPELVPASTLWLAVGTVAS